jgi:hypothetical protein
MKLKVTTLLVFMLLPFTWSLAQNQSIPQPPYDQGETAKLDPQPNPGGGPNGGARTAKTTFDDTLFQQFSYLNHELNGRTPQNGGRINLGTFYSLATGHLFDWHNNVPQGSGRVAYGQLIYGIPKLDFYDSDGNNVSLGDSFRIQRVRPIFDHVNNSGLRDTFRMKIIPMPPSGLCVPGNKIFRPDTSRTLYQAERTFQSSQGYRTDLQFFPQYTVKDTSCGVALAFEYYGPKEDTLSMATTLLAAERPNGNFWDFDSILNNTPPSATLDSLIAKADPPDPNLSANYYFGTGTVTVGQGGGQDTVLTYQESFQNNREVQYLGDLTNYLSVAHPLLEMDLVRLADTSSEDTTDTVSVTTSPHGIPKGIELNEVYPNPVQQNSLLNMNIVAAKAGEFDVRMISVTGREVYRNHRTIASPGQYRMQINTQRFEDGIYFLRFDSKEQSKVEKVVVRN